MKQLMRLLAIIGLVFLNLPNQLKAQPVSIPEIEVYEKEEMEKINNTQEAIERISTWMEKRAFAKAREKAESRAKALAQAQFFNTDVRTVLVKVSMPEEGGNTSVNIDGTGKSVMQAYLPGFLARQQNGQNVDLPEGTITYYVAFRRNQPGPGEIVFGQSLDIIADELVGNTALCKERDALKVAAETAATALEHQIQEYQSLNEKYKAQNKELEELRKQLEEHGKDSKKPAKTPPNPEKRSPLGADKNLDKSKPGPKKESSPPKSGKPQSNPKPPKEPLPPKQPPSPPPHPPIIYG